MATNGQSPDAGTAVITGGASGIGRATARLFAERGWKVLFTDIAPGGKDVETEVKDAGGEAIFVQGDVSDPEHAASLVATGTEAFGDFDVLFNCAGIIRPGTIVEAPQEDWDRTIATNLTGQYVMAKAFVPSLRRQGSGVIINVTSTAAVLGIDGLVAYCASKAGVLGLTQALAAELASDNIRVIAVSPGTVDTAMPRAALKGLEDPEGQGVALFTTHQAIKRVIQPEEVARLVLFLVSDDASCMTGNRIDFDAGWVATQDAH